ncbi:AbrB/MazE/SpoVT family DNA-binding domain-containing protein [Sulfuritalea sp.]|uniref:AbrB/MazE/SpoVT family DNA-binding domain-containing protein n=1 Tax=Sulfuritalea sp. TaxID=2480090 RepID=UPI001AC9C449|nr:AbrB/MazE/SpoVT family DNA-binding domain-containing protein [Sulfuritalea sp.]MBN8475172.1 AbrB/MazE/SpoVT family DNA-binding domain-containing protein [Sulfuritalea sp.]
MTTVRVSSKGQIVIPRQLRAAFHIEAGSELSITAEGDELRLRQAEQRFPRTEVAPGLGLLARPGRKAPAAEDIKRGVGEMLKRKNAAR